MSDRTAPVAGGADLDVAAVPRFDAASSSGSSLEEVRTAVRGDVLVPGDNGYEDARRIWNGMIDRRPAVIVRCVDAADVIAAMQFARGQRLRVAVRGGGHNVAGNAIVDGGLVLDLTRMNSVRVDPEERVVRVGGGALLADVDHATQAFGLAAPLGLVSETGVAGLTLHGGLGAMTRRYGLSIDNLLSADVVTADGRLLVADERRNSDLFWALRGGGGNFGVVTSFEFRLHPVGPEISVALVLYPASEGPRVLDFFRRVMPTAPDELMGIALYWNAPEAEPVPEQYRGAPVIVVGCWHTGPLAQAEHDLQPFRQITIPIADLSDVMPYAVAQTLFDHDYPKGRRYYWKSLYLPELSDDMIAVAAEFAATRPSPLNTVEVWGLGGAFGRVPADATAFGRRNMPYLFTAESNWDDPADDDANIRWAREAYEAMRRFSPDGTYLNFLPGLAEEGQDLLRRSYGANYERLRSVKAKYDPENVFRSNFNIEVEG